LRHGANPFYEYIDGTFPLWVSAEKGNVLAVKMLLEHCKKRNCFEELIWQRKRKTLSTPLYLACQNGFFNIVKVLLQNGALVNPKTAFGSTPIFVAAERGYIVIVRMLLQYGADLSYRTNVNTVSVADKAYSHNHLEVGDLLMENIYAGQQAQSGNVRWFIDQIESTTLTPYWKQWAPWMEWYHNGQMLLAYILTRLKESIKIGFLSTLHESLLDVLVYDLGVDCVHFFKWVYAQVILEKMCQTEQFNEKYPDFVQTEITSFLIHPKIQSRVLLRYIYLKYYSHPVFQDRIFNLS
jgi:hypothetical protein